MIEYLYFILFISSSYFLICTLGNYYLKKYKKIQLNKKTNFNFDLKWSFVHIITSSLAYTCAFYDYQNNNTLLYSISEIKNKGYFYTISNLFFNFLLYDIYEYFIHRLLHTKWFYRNIHYIHHKNNSPDLLSSFVFHPFETFLLILPLITIKLIPMCDVLFLLLSTIFYSSTILQHCGFYIPFYENYLGYFFVSPEHHDIHHLKSKGNYGIFTPFCDYLLNTKLN